MSRRVYALASLLIFAFSSLMQAAATTTTPPPPQEIKRVTLYSPLKPENASRRGLYSFKTGAFEGNIHLWDLSYGSLYVGDEMDWFSVSTGKDVRSAFRDLGALDWSDSFTIPVVTPFPKLKEGEQRNITVDSSGADGADGAPGAPGADADGVVRVRPEPQAASAKPRRPKHDGVPKVDPIFTKAIVGHMYVLRVVDEVSDFYVLFRVEEVVKGDNCTITWKRIAGPSETAAQ